MGPRYTGPQGQRPDVGDCALKRNLKWLVQSTDLNAVGSCQASCRIECVNQGGFRRVGAS